MRVLLIEDDSATARSIELMLRSEGLDVCTTDLGEEGIDLGKLYGYDIIVLDLQLPDMSGFEVLMALRVAKVQTPVLILSGNAIVETKVMGLGFGADDYMTKPLHQDELVARIQAVVRRSKKHSSGACKVHSNFAVASRGGNYIKTEWETGYMLRDLDGGQVVVA
jgi:two-component system cell cycle response regulator CtrA